MFYPYRSVRIDPSSPGNIVSFAARRHRPSLFALILVGVAVLVFFALFVLDIAALNSVP